MLQSNSEGINEMTIEKFWGGNDGNAIIVLPLSPENRAKWDQQKAYDWFKSVEGSPYGFANFLFGFLDTPNDNFPQVMDSNSWFTLISIIYSIPEIGPEMVDLVWSRGLSKRLGFATEELTWH